jgi:hypothetical protein
VAARLGRLRGGACTSTREIDGFLTALTYQSLATFDDGAELDESRDGSLLDGLHPTAGRWWRG